MVRRFTAVFLLSIFVLTTLQDLTVLLALRFLSIIVIFVACRCRLASTPTLSKIGVLSLAVLLALAAVSLKTRVYTSNFD